MTKSQFLSSSQFFLLQSFPPPSPPQQPPAAAAFKHLEKCAFERVPVPSEVMYRCFNDTLITPCLLLWWRTGRGVHLFWGLLLFVFAGSRCSSPYVYSELDLNYWSDCWMIAECCFGEPERPCCLCYMLLSSCCPVSLLWPLGSNPAEMSWHSFCSSGRFVLVSMPL